MNIDFTNYRRLPQPIAVFVFGERFSGKSAFVSSISEKMGFVPCILSSYRVTKNPSYKYAEVQAFMEMEKDLAKIGSKRVGIIIEQDFQKLGDSKRVPLLFSSILRSLRSFGYLIQGVWMGPVGKDSVQEHSFNRLTAEFQNYVVIDSGKIVKQEGVNYAVLI